MSTPEPENHLPSASLAALAYVSGMGAYQKLVDEAERDHEAYWARLARELLAWKQPFTKVLNAGDAPFYKWQQVRSETGIGAATAAAH